MFLCRHSDLVEVRRADNRGKGGRGVFATRDVPADTLLERVPVLLLPKNQVFGKSEVAKRMAHISWYVFDWEGVTKREYVALALGYGSIYNHSPNPNARVERHAPDVLEFHTVRAIAAGEEIFINYLGFEPTEGKTDVGFEVK
ncbi:MAG TPA: SET domain-containing protein-lysine N-methyltransferase [Humisphaera sp.]